MIPIPLLAAAVLPVAGAGTRGAGWSKSKGEMVARPGGDADMRTAGGVYLPGEDVTRIWWASWAALRSASTAVGPRKAAGERSAVGHICHSGAVQASGATTSVGPFDLNQIDQLPPSAQVTRHSSVPSSPFLSTPLMAVLHGLPAPLINS